MKSKAWRGWSKCFPSALAEMAWGDKQSTRRAGAADGRRSVRALCRLRSPRHRRRRRRSARRRSRGGGHRTAPRRYLGRHLAKLLTALIEPKLGNGRATLLTGYPAGEAPLARVSADDPRIAERFELYCCGVELANGFGELTDPELQRQRLEAEMDKKQERYGGRYPIDDDFIAALAHMPPASGCAMGFDRVVMLATGATRIDQVLWTPLPRA